MGTDPGRQGDPAEHSPGSLGATLELLGFQEGEKFALAAIRDRKIEPACFTDVRRAEAWLMLHEDQNVYLTLNPVDPEFSGGRPKATDIHRTPWLLVDLDPENQGDDLAPVAQRLHEKYGGIHVFSGRGHQIWLNVGEGADRAGILRRLRSEVSECKVDAVHDAGRLARLPGSTNLKTGAEARVISSAPSRPPEPLSRPRREVKVVRASDEEVAAILDVLDPDMDYNDWLRVGMALHHAGQEIEVWESWSAKGAKYQEGDCERWYGFSADCEEAVTVGTLRHFAVEAGWDPGEFLKSHRGDGELWSWIEGAGLLTSDFCKSAGMTKAEAKRAAKEARVAAKLANLPDDEVRYTADDDKWWFHHAIHGWQAISLSNLNVILGEGADRIREALIRDAWIQVGEPFEPEELAGRRWNRNGALLIEPEAGEWPTIKIAIDRLEEALGEPGYLYNWAGFLVQNPRGKLPALFLYSAENTTGKSSFAFILRSLFLRGAVDAAGVLKGGDGSRFTEELEGAVFAWFDEEKASRAGMDKLKKLVTENTLLWEGKGVARKIIPNYTHIVITSNHPDTVPFDTEDQRVVMWEVPPLESPTEKSAWEARVEEEAPAFLEYLLNMDLPEPVGRVQLPVLKTDVKIEQAESGMDPVAIYVRRNPDWIVTPLKEIARAVGLDTNATERGLPVGKRRAWRALSRMKELGLKGSASEIVSKLGLDMSPISMGKYLAQAERLGLAKRSGSPTEWEIL